tara:strand:- start:2315 stop:2560 length:246 start_codon:yes stop_codon:yes gene_type:complete
MEIPMAKDIRIPGEIENKGAATVQKWFVVGGLGSGVISWAAFSNDAAGTGFWAAVICVGALFIASKIRTKKKFKGGAGIYK